MPILSSGHAPDVKVRCENASRKIAFQPELQATNRQKKSFLDQKTSLAILSDHSLSPDKNEGLQQVVKRIRLKCEALHGVKGNKTKRLVSRLYQKARLRTQLVIIASPFRQLISKKVLYLAQKLPKKS
jgi:hypothetical protein